MFISPLSLLRLKGLTQNRQEGPETFWLWYLNLSAGITCLKVNQEHGCSSRLPSWDHGLCQAGLSSWHPARACTGWSRTATPAGSSGGKPDRGEEWAPPDSGLQGRNPEPLPWSRGFSPALGTSPDSRLLAEAN